MSLSKSYRLQKSTRHEGLFSVPPSSSRRLSSDDARSNPKPSVGKPSLLYFKFKNFWYENALFIFFRTFNNIGADPWKGDSSKKWYHAPITLRLPLQWCDVTRGFCLYVPNVICSVRGYFIYVRKPGRDFILFYCFGPRDRLYARGRHETREGPPPKKKGMKQDSLWWSSTIVNTERSMGLLEEKGGGLLVDKNKYCFFVTRCWRSDRECSFGWKYLGFSFYHHI